MKRGIPSHRAAVRTRTAAARLPVSAGVVLALLAVVLVALPTVLLQVVDVPAAVAPPQHFDRPAELAPGSASNASTETPGQSANPSAATHEPPPDHPSQPDADAPDGLPRSANAAPPDAEERSAEPPGEPAAVGPLGLSTADADLVREALTRAAPALEATPEPTGAPPAAATAPPPSPTVRVSQRTKAQARRAAVQRFGGSPETEDAVELALAWLVRHQDADGGWSRFTFDRQCPDNDRCPGAALRRRDDSLRVGLTGLTLLALLGAGYADDQGPYREPVARAVAALLNAQAPDGGFPGDDAMAGYNHALATLALAEYFALTGNENVRPALTAAVARLAAAQQELGGWDYLARSDTGRNDTSITGWTVQALASAAAVGVELPPGVLPRATLHFQRAAGADGRVWYSDAGSGFEIEPRTFRPVHRFGPAMTAAGVTSEVLLGWRLDAELLQRQRAWLLTQPPSQFAMERDPTNLHDYYYWYYGTMAMFQAGGDDWQRWNAALRDALLPLQDRREKPGGGRAHTFGSWPPYGQGWGKWGRMGGRVYTTAIAALTLEVYYRHPPAYLEAAAPIRSREWRAFLQQCSPRERPQALAILAQCRAEIAEPVLLEQLASTTPGEALAAALGLAEMGSPRGRAQLENGLPAATALQRPRIARAIEQLTATIARGPTTGTVRYFDAATGMATIDLPAAYIGQRIALPPDPDAGGDPLAGQVILRFTGRDTAVVAFDQPPRRALRAGETVQGRHE